MKASIISVLIFVLGLGNSLSTETSKTQTKSLDLVIASEAMNVIINQSPIDAGKENDASNNQEGWVRAVSQNIDTLDSNTIIWTYNWLGSSTNNFVLFTHNDWNLKIKIIRTMTPIKIVEILNNDALSIIEKSITKHLAEAEGKEILEQIEVNREALVEKLSIIAVTHIAKFNKIYGEERTLQELDQLSDEDLNKILAYLLKEVTKAQQDNLAKSSATEKSAMNRQWLRGKQVEDLFGSRTEEIIEYLSQWRDLDLKEEEGVTRFEFGVELGF